MPEEGNVAICMESGLVREGGDASEATISTVPLDPTAPLQTTAEKQVTSEYAPRACLGTGRTLQQNRAGYVAKFRGWRSR